MIQLQSVPKEYDQPGAEPSLIVAANSLSLDIPAGEIFGLIGPNGAGKTTTLKMVCGLLSPTAGQISVNQVDVESHPEEAQKHIGYLADFFSVYGNLKVWEYLDYFARAYKLDSENANAAETALFREPHHMPIGSLFVPSALFLLDPAAWIEGPAVWVSGLVLQALPDSPVFRFAEPHAAGTPG